MQLVFFFFFFFANCFPTREIEVKEENQIGFAVNSFFDPIFTLEPKSNLGPALDLYVKPNANLSANLSANFHANLTGDLNADLSANLGVIVTNLTSDENQISVERAAAVGVLLGEKSGCGMVNRKIVD